MFEGNGKRGFFYLRHYQKSIPTVAKEEMCMAWATEHSEIQAGREEIWGKYSVEGGYRQDIVVDGSGDDPVFYGKIVDGQNVGVSGVILFISACTEDGSEIPLAYTYSGEDGNYLLSVKKPDAAVAKYIVRAGSSTVSTV